MIDARVYDVQVCKSCLTQVPFDADGNPDPCPHCDGLETKVVRFRVDRSQVLKQADPHKSLVERTVYFGCVGQAGHYYFDRNLRHIGRYGHYEDVSPWGNTVDGGLIPKGTPLRQGEAHVVHKDGWTAVVFADSSVDHRPGSWSVFCVPDTLDGPNALIVARAAFPTIFARYPFPIKLA